jgi:HK97 family phage prohead protease/HK97 family phage major capsid protein
MSEIETRSFQVRLADTEERTITGLAVPYGQEANIGGQYKERFEPGAIDNVDDVKLFYAHEEPIGKVIAGRDTDGGYEITAKISMTPRGEEVLTLLRDGVLNKFSVGFVPVEDRWENNNSTVTRTKVDLREVSVVAWPAFSGATISEVRNDVEILDTPGEVPTIESEEMSESMELDVRTALDEVAELRRDLEAVKTVQTVSPAAPAFRSQGEFAKALVAGEEEAKVLARTASTSADTYAAPGFIGFINNLIAANRPSWNVWSSTSLPAAGMTVEYATVSANTLAVGEQDPENEALSFGNLSIDSVSANVKTYGGYTTMSRQTIERSSVNYLDTAFQALAIAYSNATNTAAKAAIAALDFTGKVMDLDGGTAASVIEGLIDGIKYIKTNSGLNAEFILCSADSYKYFMKIADSSGRPIVDINRDGSNTIGRANNDLTGSIWGLPVIVDPSLGTGLAYLANSNALRVLEAPGAPVRLTDGDVTTLTDSISVYGYAAITVPFASAIVKLDITA